MKISLEPKRKLVLLNCDVILTKTFRLLLIEAALQTMHLTDLTARPTTRPSVRHLWDLPASAGIAPAAEKEGGGGRWNGDRWHTDPSIWEGEIRQSFLLYKGVTSTMGVFRSGA
jgi:hypothetical protein